MSESGRCNGLAITSGGCQGHGRVAYDTHTEGGGLRLLLARRAATELIVAQPVDRGASYIYAHRV